MNRIIRFWNQNRRKIITGILVIVLVVIVIQVLNEISKNNDKNKQQTVLTQEEKLLPTKSIIGGESVSVKETKQNLNEIDEFVKLCNNGDVEGAYNMLTDDCKKALYSTSELFKSGYYDMFFKTKKIVNTEQFLSQNNRYTYKVKFIDDLLSTGNTESSSGYQDYITIDKNSQNGKINLNGLIYREEINKENEINGIKVLVVAKEVYKENEKLEIKIENKSDKRIMINSNQDNSSVYILGSNGIKYNSYISELSSIVYEIPSYFYRIYKIKFNKIYSAGVSTDKVVFTDIVTDLEKYKIAPEQAKQRLKISVDI